MADNLNLQNWGKNTHEVIKHKLLTLLSKTPCSLNQIIDFLQIEIKFITPALSELELDGKIMRLKGGFYVKS